MNVSPADLEPLRGLPRLRELRLRHTNPHRTPGGLPLDLDPLSGAAALEVLVLPGRPVHDLSPLRGLVALRELDVEPRSTTLLPWSTRRGCRCCGCAPHASAVSNRSAG